MKILVITTGGTIGSVFDGASIDVSGAAASAVTQMYCRAYADVSFDTLSPLNILSENITAQDLNALARIILRTNYEGYDGVIFTAGSDNLAYIASLVGLLCGNIGKPVAVVATDRVLSDPRANGYPNFVCAVELIRRGHLGAYVPYRNTDGVMYIHSATDIRQADLSDDFYSFHGAYAVYEDGDIVPQNEYIEQTVPAVFDAEHLPDISGDVMLIHPYPMLDYTAASIEGKRSVLHTLYHSATLDSIRAKALIDRAGDRPVYLASLRSGRQLYRTTADMIAYGAVPLYDISPECAYIKLVLACAQERFGIADFMESNLG